MFETILSFFMAAMLLGIVSDIRSMTIPNRLNIALVAAFVLSAFWAGMPAAGMGAHALTALGTLAITVLMFQGGWMGGGDAKLIAATSLWFGPSLLLLDYLLLASVLGGVLTLVLMSARALREPTTGIVFVDRLLAPRNGVPYGVALGAAGLVVGLRADWTGVLT